MVLQRPAPAADDPPVLILQALAIAATLTLVWLCIAVVGDLAARERMTAEAAREAPAERGV